MPVGPLPPLLVALPLTLARHCRSQKGGGPAPGAHPTVSVTGARRMATSQTTPTPGRRPPRDPAHPGAAPDDGADPVNPYENTPGHPDARGTLPMAHYLTDLDRKSTRLNSSHVASSYAVFCLKKK